MGGEVEREAAPRAAMTRDEKIRQLRETIEDRLGGVVDRDHVLLGLPYYLNVGDILIWEGTRQYLATRPFACLNPGWRYRDEGRIREDTLILLQGGGNFGDLWRWVQDERLGILRRHPDNPAVILPVSCWYEDEAVMRRDAEELAAHPDLTICARDQASYDLLTTHFRNRILLLPDMAFCIDPAPLRRWKSRHAEGAVHIRRTDKEYAGGGEGVSAAPGPAVVADWPSAEADPWHWTAHQALYRWGLRARRQRAVWRLADPAIRLSDLFFHQVCRRLLIREGAAFLGRFREIRTTRMHAAILAILMDKEVELMDNTYGKSSGFYRTWLDGVDGVRMMG